MAKWEYSFKAFKDRISGASSEEALEELSDLLEELGQTDAIPASEYMALDHLLDRRLERLSLEGVI